MNIFLIFFQWWLVIFLIGIVFLPLTFKLLGNFFDKGYLFSKIIGIVIISYAVFLLGLSHIAPFSPLTIFGVILISLGVNLLIFRYNFIKIIKKNWAIFVFEEIIFLLGIIAWAFVKSHAPDIHGLEKFMDFGFINSILRSDYFPPKDMWFTPLSINYYYFGHLMTAVVTRISFISSAIAYNLMLATLFSFTFSLSFSIGANLIYMLKSQMPNHKLQINSKNKKFKLLDLGNLNLFRTWNFGFEILIGGFLTGFLVSLSGNLQTIYAFFKNFSPENPLPFWRLVFSFTTFPNSYWYPNATRFIHNTIHEFPSYSFVVSDLHGHVLDIPIVLLVLAIFLNGFKNITKNLNFKLLIFVSFLLAVMYMTNAWDGLIYFMFAGILFLGFVFHSMLISSEKEFSIYNAIRNIFILGAGFFVFILPFSLNFKPFASGIGLLCAPEFLIKMGKLGPFLFEASHCQKSPWWQVMTLHGFFYFFVFSFIIFLIPKIKIIAANAGSRLETTSGKNYYIKVKNILPTDGFILILITVSTFLVIIPEIFYIKDIYPDHYRANTMFKLTYQEFIMLSIASAYILMRFILNFKKNIKKNKILIPYFIFSIILLTMVFTYPFFSTGSYFNNLKTNYGLDGTTYLKNLYPQDYSAIQWINKNIKNQPVILEAQGDSYTDYARISSNTGLPTVLGWTVHEWLWRGTYDVPAPRIAEVQSLYETRDVNQARNLMKKYNISYVYVGALEVQKYLNLSEDKFKKIGKVVYQNNNTKIYKITP
ncbi:MAG: DUF2298 domain-containing protein [Patescibacteria group bacterium]|mgnify:CR=1 FL=1